MNAVTSATCRLPVNPDLVCPNDPTVDGIPNVNSGGVPLIVPGLMLSPAPPASVTRTGAPGRPEISRSTGANAAVAWGRYAR